ncbi:hypothetical protein FHS42_006206 [Streptomyces zagrosensis]|uniref:Uncharacterized protein n=1 Tax=Streptomyces zagrosensis TaxID=1042984 RepID=A0A7W9QFK8_9ACTN|nr:hypothetical protein [Streptomyces zagrosensis]
MAPLVRPRSALHGLAVVPEYDASLAGVGIACLVTRVPAGPLGRKTGRG